MRFDSELQREVFNYFDKRKDFFYFGNTGTFFFNSWEKGKEKHLMKSKKPHGDKDSISTSVSIYSNRYPDNRIFGVEMKIVMFMWGHQTEEPVFQGWVESIEDLKIICKSTGL